MATAQVSSDNPVLLHDVSWKTYESLLKDYDGRPIRLTYDRGELEIMALSHEHERYAELIASLIILFALELGIPIHLGGSTTFKKRTKKKGLEPDKCYWIQNEPRMRCKKEFDIASDPPPDLAIEVEVSRSALDRMKIFAALGIPEVWRVESAEIRVYVLGASGRYNERADSLAFPDLPVKELTRFLQESETTAVIKLLASFRTWIHEHILPVRQKRPSDRTSEKARKPRQNNNR